MSLTLATRGIISKSIINNYIELQTPIQIEVANPISLDVNINTYNINVEVETISI